MDHVTYINAQISERAKRIADLERDLVELRAELRAYEDIKARLVGDAAPVRRASRAPAEAVSPTIKRKLGTLSKILIAAAVRAYPDPVSTDDGVNIAAERTGEDVPRNNVRASFWANSKAGFLERAGEGLFRATEAGARMIGERLDATDNQTNGANAAHQTEGDGESDAANGDQAEARDLLSRTGGEHL